MPNYPSLRARRVRSSLWRQPFFTTAQLFFTIRCPRRILHYEQTRVCFHVSTSEPFILRRRRNLHIRCNRSSFTPLEAFFSMAAAILHYSAAVLHYPSPPTDSSLRATRALHACAAGASSKPSDRKQCSELKPPPLSPVLRVPTLYYILRGVPPACVIA